MPQREEMGENADGALVTRLSGSQNVACGNSCSGGAWLHASRRFSREHKPTSRTQLETGGQTALKINTVSSMALVMVPAGF